MPKTISVLVIGPAPAGANSRGGMATVSRLMIEHPDERFVVRAVPTYVDGSRTAKIRTGIVGTLTAVWTILRGRVDVVHVHLAHGGSVLRKSLPLMAARRRRVSTVVHGHSYDFVGWFDSLADPVARLVRMGLRADRWLVLGDELADEYSDRLRIPRDRVGVLYNPVRLPNRVSEQVDLEVVHIVTLGRLGERKGSYDLVRALAMLEPSVTERIRVSMCGDGEIGEVEAAIEAAGISNVVTVPGWLSAEDADELLSAAQIFVLPSYQEGLPMALLEAMGHGLAPITTAVGSIGEVITPGRNGVLVEPSDIDALTRAVTTLVTDDDARRTLARNAREQAENFDLDSWYAEIARVWTALYGDRSAR
ncbi:glycosyltransferase family 4 protein [Rhodococcus sp. NPDC058521]|uniref:glycosyltransferase family 4 protein n=1 Tax=Rhodococcus sp. NPDC058521 TaxID=3346536 RepID=UPI003656A044